MIPKSVVVAIALFSSSLALAASPGIGTVSTRGEIKVDGYTVRGTATLFDNSAVETKEFAATLRLDAGTEIKLGTGSSGTLYRDRLVLSRGETQLTSATPFQLDAEGLSILPGSTGTVGVVSLSSPNKVEVAALKGQLRVLNSHGALLAEVSPGTSLALSAGPGAQNEGGAQDTPGAQAAPAPGAPPATLSDIGLLSFENGRFYLSSSLSGLKYEITGNDLSKYIGDKVVIEGTVVSGTAFQPVSVAIKSIAINGPPTGLSKTGKFLIAAALVGEGATLGYVIAAASR